jgi:hypothetical protein
MRQILASCVALATLIFVAAPVTAAVITHVEGVDGNFSQNTGTPQFVGGVPTGVPTNVGVFDVGANRIEGGLNDGSGPNDVFTFSIAAGQELTSVVLDVHTPDSPPTTFRSFFAIHNAATFPVFEGYMLDQAFAADNGVFLSGNEFLGGLLVGDVLDTNILLDPNPTTNTIANNNQFIGQGFTDPLGEGQYTVYIQQTAALNTQYEYDFIVSNVAAVPEPSSAALLFGMCAVLGGIRRKR